MEDLCSGWGGDRSWRSESEEIARSDEICKMMSLGAEMEDAPAATIYSGVAKSFCTFSPGRNVLLNVLYFFLTLLHSALAPDSLIECPTQI